MRKIILIFCLVASVVFGQEELISCNVECIDINRYMGDWFGDYDRAFYYARYNISTSTIEWIRIQTNQFIYNLEYTKGDRRMNVYVMWDEELESFEAIKYKVFSKTEYGADVVIEGIKADDGGFAYKNAQFTDLRVARVDRRFGDITFENEVFTFDYYKGYDFYINDLKRAYKIYKYNLDLEPKANKTGIIRYKNGGTDFVFATEYSYGKAFTQEDIDNINKAELLVPLWHSALIFNIGNGWFDWLDEFWQ